MLFAQAGIAKRVVSLARRETVMVSLTAHDLPPTMSARRSNVDGHR
jgi:hypothetical protein